MRRIGRVEFTHLRERFDTHRFADYKEKVIDLLMRVPRVSWETYAIVEAMCKTPH